MDPAPFSWAVNEYQNQIQSDVDLFFLYTNWYLQALEFRLLINNTRFKILDYMKYNQIQYPMRIIDNANCEMTVSMSTTHRFFTVAFERGGDSPKATVIEIFMKDFIDEEAHQINFI
ncbi:unnamed protein product [Rotaria sordida]|uniref:Uncharacterized protein n=1 Tax=Rotaria sordida TaxID=392033 RepID=A0A819JH46_9BILA|nr:unnamed protein product [Rotaria sordida]